MEKYVCTICGYIYDPEVGCEEDGISPGTPFDEIDADWKCPLCAEGKDVFELEA